MLRPVLALALFCAAAWAQETSGNIGGTVRDPAGGVVPNASVTATAIATGERYRATTGQNGAFLLTLLPIGGYELAAEAPGFRAFRRRGIELHLNDRLSLEIILQVGPVSEEVTVTAEAPPVQLESPEVSGLVDGEQVRELALNGRSFMTLVELLPGVSSDLPDRTDQNTNPTLQVNGGRPTSNNWMVDGGDNVDFGNNNALNNFTSIETIAEFRVMTSNYSAEYGRGGGAQVNVVTKRGTKQFHGSLFHFLRNEKVNATSFFTHSKLPLKQNDFGGTLGGPLRRGGDPKTFFFAAVNLDRKSLANSDVIGTVPTLLERQGDFSDSPTKPNDPDTARAFPNGIIPAARMDPLARALADKIYPPPTPGFRAVGRQNYFSTLPARQNWAEGMIRLDHNFSSRVRLYGRYLQDSAEVTNPFGGSVITARSRLFPDQDRTLSHRPGKNVIVNLQVAFTPRRLAEFGYNYSSRTIERETVQFLSQDEFGVAIPKLFAPQKGNPLPDLNVSGYSLVGSETYWLVEDFAHHASATFTEMRGRHLLKYGAVAGTYGKNENPGSADLNGSFTFTGARTRVGLGDFLLGLANAYTEAERDIRAHIRFPEFALFWQDDVKLRPNLTLNLGLRYEIFRSPIDTGDLLTTFVPALFDPARAPQLMANGNIVPGTGDPLNGIVVAGKSSPYGRRITDNQTHTFGPRIGLVWDPTRKGKTAIRAGFGLYHSRWLMGMFENNVFSNPPFLYDVTLNNTLLSNPAGGTAAPLSPPNLTTTGLPLLLPTTYQYSFGVQRDLGRLGNLSVSYVGSRGVHLLRPVNLNQPRPGQAAGQNVNLVRPYRGYGSILERQTSASSRYDSLQVAYRLVRRRTLTFGVAYTWSKTLTDSSDDRAAGQSPQSSYDFRPEWGLASFDRPHVFTANYIWEVPWGRSLHGAWGAALQGWQVSGITRFQSGPALTITDGADRAGVGQIGSSASPQRPDVAGPLHLPKQIEQWFDRSAFRRAPVGSFGNAGRGLVRAPGINSWTLSGFKNFRFTEQVRFQLRAEFFNAFNHPSFTGVGASISSSTNFGVITGTRDPRVVQLALKLYW